MCFIVLVCLNIFWLFIFFFLFYFKKCMVLYGFLLYVFVKVKEWYLKLLLIIIYLNVYKMYNIDISICI